MEETIKKEAHLTIRRLARFGITARTDDKGNIVLLAPLAEGGKAIALPPDKMNRLLDESCNVSVSFLKEGVFDNILAALYMMNYS